MGNTQVILQEIEEIKKVMITVKHRKLTVIKGNIEHHYVCNTCVWNYWLGRLYPKAELVLTVEHIKE